MAVKDRRRLDDHYSRRARREGFPARSVYKLEEIDNKYKLLKPGQIVLDLGCAPGSWTLYAAAQVGAQGRVLAVDLNEPASSWPPQATFVQGDLLKMDLSAFLPEKTCDVLLSDMAPKTMGRREVDQARSLELGQIAWSWAQRLLKPGGHFVCKLFQSPDAEELAREIGSRFKQFSRLKPQATRSQSVEIFVVGRGYVAERALQMTDK